MKVTLVLIGALLLSAGSCATACTAGALVVTSPAPAGLRLKALSAPIDRPLEDVLRRLLPVDWTIDNPSHAAGRSVQSPTDTHLEPALRTLALRADACLTLDGARLTVRIAPVAQTTPLAPMPSATSSPPSAPPVEARMPLAPLDADLASAVGQEGFYSLHVGQTIREAFTAWAKSAGYTVVWQAPIDLTSDVDLTFPPGTQFKSAVKQTLGAFWRSKQALTGKLYKNRVLVISGRNG